MKQISSNLKLFLVIWLSVGLMSTVSYAQENTTQKDMSHTKSMEEVKKNHPSRFVPVGKYGNAVTPFNLKEALRTPDKFRTALFASSGLKEFPKELFEFKGLMEIDISNNNLEVIPENLAQFKNLKELHINGNSIKSISDNFSNLSQLEVLQLQGNPLEYITPSLGNFQQLRELWMGDISPLCAIPKEIWSLKNMRKLRLINCHLKEIPSSIINLKQLDELCLASNKISLIPENICNLSTVTYLNFGDNQISEIPQCLSIISNLDYLGLYGNPIKELPKSISKLNKLRFLPVWNTNISQASLDYLKKAMPETAIPTTDADVH